MQLDRDDLSRLQSPRTRMVMIQIQNQILPAKDHAEVRQNRKVHLKQVQAIPSLNPIKSRYQLASTCLWTLRSKINLILMCTAFLSALLQ